MLPTEIAVNNLEVVQFAFMNYQISLDVVTNR